MFAAILLRMFRVSNNRIVAIGQIVRRLIVFVTVSILLITVIIMAVRGMGQWLAPGSAASTIVTTEDCPQPCWRGIRPGQTTISEATALLKANRPFIESVYAARQGKDVPTLDEAICWTIAVSPRWQGCAGHGVLEAGPVTQVELSPPSGSFTLGEAIILFGDPVAVQMCRRFTSVYFSDDVEVIVTTGQAPYLDPRQSVFLVRFLYPNVEPPFRFDIPAWRGFIKWHGDPIC